MMCTSLEAVEPAMFVVATLGQNPAAGTMINLCLCQDSKFSSWYRS